MIKTLEDWEKITQMERKSIGKKFFYQSKFHPEKTVYVQHGKEYISLIFKTIRMHDSKVFIELGTFMGGLTLVIHEEFEKLLRIFSFDYKEQISWEDRYLLFDSRTVFFYKENILFHEDKTVLTHLLKNLSGTRKILYCDNGNKEDEINFYAKYLDRGDLVGCHDYLVEVIPPKIENTLKAFVPYNWDEWENSRLLSRFWIKK